MDHHKKKAKQNSIKAAKIKLLRFVLGNTRKDRLWNTEIMDILDILQNDFGDSRKLWSHTNSAVVGKKKIRW